MPHTDQNTHGTIVYLNPSQMRLSHVTCNKLHLLLCRAMQVRTAVALVCFVAETLSRLREQVCLYFVNLVLEDYENYTFWNTPDMLTRRNMYPHRFAPMRKAPPHLSRAWPTPVALTQDLLPGRTIECECCVGQDNHQST